jgi:site-specific recombinase XerD
MGDYTVNVLANEWQKLLFRISFRTINDGTDLRVHDLRHIYSQSLLNMGVSLEDIQSLLGHQDFSTTQRRYAQFARPDLLDKGSKIDNMIKIKRTS